MREGPEADLDHAAGRRELHGRRQPRRLAEVAVPHRRSIRTKGSCCTRSPTTTTAGAARSCTARRSRRWSCPTATRRPLHGWKNAFDAGEWGLGRMTQPLTLGCDCLGEIFYFDATLANEQGKPWVIPNAICMHEEDYGILWKHVDLLGRPLRGAAQPPAGRELRRDRRQLRVRLLLVLLPRRQHPARGEAHRASCRRWRSSRARSPSSRTSIGVGVAAPHHQHMFNARLDFDVDGPVNEVYEVEAERMPPGPDNPWLNAFRQRSTRLDTELDGAPRRRRRALAHVADRQPAGPQRARSAGRLQARADDVDAHAARASGLADRAARRLRAAQPLGHALRTRRAAGRGRVPEPARRRRRPAALDRAGPERSPTPTSWSGTRSA